MVSLVATRAQAAPRWEFHRKFLQEKYDLSKIKEIWSDDSWHIRCIFTDIDGDGRDEMIALTVSGEDRTGNVWNFWKVGEDGSLRQLDERSPIGFWCDACSFYKMVYRDGSSLTLGLGMKAGYMDEEYRRIVRPTPDCVFSIKGQDRLVVREITPSLDFAFRGREVTRIERLNTEYYLGFDFRPPSDADHNPHGLQLPYKPPKGDLRPGGGVVAPPGFAAFVARYRDEVRRRRGTPTGKLSVYAVFLDADNDGAADCYVTSDAARVSEGVYDWELYLDWEGTLEKADEEIHPDEGNPELCVLKPSVRAGKRAFCRVLRYDALPTFVVLDAESSAKTKVRDAIIPYSAHRIEKLDCIEFPETSISK